MSYPTTRVKETSVPYVGGGGHYCRNIKKHHFGPQMRGLIGNPPSPAAPQLRMTSSDSSMAHFSYGKRAPRPCEHISVFCRFSKEGSKKGHLAPIVAHSAYSRRIFGIAHTVWDAGVRISTALDIRRGSGPTVHSIACLREGSV